ncbi:MAG TPA: FMN-binding negative transcriptional regulator [Caulobacteraceae bacterium]
MHPAGQFRETSRARLTALVDDVGFAVVIGCGSAGPVIAHAPVLLAGDTVRFHLSAANSLCPILQKSPAALVVVTGPDAYVSPDWYGSDNQVPTWNYLAAEIAGLVRRMDREQTATLLDDLAAHFEAKLKPKPPWRRSKLDPGRFEALLGAIVGFEMTINRLEGVRKLSQNKTDEDLGRLAAHLANRANSGARELARLMMQSPQGRSVAKAEDSGPEAPP